nr:putative ribonuclease H-like domain-containing protein [Tanacetum cinerariifolium]
MSIYWHSVNTRMPRLLFEAIQARFSGNDAIKKTQNTLLKQMYENFNAPSTESLDSIFNRLQKIVSQLAILVSAASTPVSTVSSPNNIANLSDATVYAFLANHPNRTQLVHKDLEQIHEDDLRRNRFEMAVSFAEYESKKVLPENRECRSPRNQESRPRNQESLRKTVIVKDTSSKAMAVINGAGFDWSYMADDKVPTNMALMAFSNSEVKFVNTAKGKSVTSVVGKQRTNAVKPSACWVWRPKIKVQYHVFKNSGSYIYYQEYDGGFVAFAGSSKGDKITVKMCDKKNSVLFTETEYLILSPDFKLLDKNQVLLKVPRKNNMYSFDIKNVVPSKGLTCLFAKVINNESNLWHRRLGHINLKKMNKLVKGNHVRGIPSMIFENDHTCVACHKGK